MTFTVPKDRTANDALLAALRAVHARIGDAEAPENRTLPYAVLYPLGRTAESGPVGDPHADTVSSWQVTVVGAGREQVQDLTDRLRAAAVLLTVLGERAVMRVTSTGQPVRRDDEVNPALFYATEQYRYHLTPA